MANNNSNSRKKLDEYHIKVLRELAALPCNKNCFDCNQRGPTYVNVTIGSFVCTKCSGILRGLTPPNRVKSISMTTFTPEEIEMLKSRGNDYCRRVWLGLCDNSIQYKDEQQIKDFMIDKYEKKRYYIDPSTLPNLKVPVSQSSSQPLLTSPSQQTAQVVPPKSIPLRTTQITLTNGSAAPPTSSAFPADFQLSPRDPFSSSNGTSHVPRNSRSQQPQQQQQPSFANFDNAVFSSVQQGTAAVPEPHKKPMTAPLEIPKEDKYAALKDLDSIMKQQQLGTTPTTLDNQNVNSDTSSSSNGWNSSGGGGMFGSPATSSPMFPSSNMFGTSPKMNGYGSVFGSPGGRSSESQTCNGTMSAEVANPFNNAANPFRSDGGWPSQTMSSNGSVMNGGFPLSQSMDFATAKSQWPMVNHHIANPFKMNTAAPQTTAPHHSSNPFL